MEIWVAPGPSSGGGLAAPQPGPHSSAHLGPVLLHMVVGGATQALPGPGGQGDLKSEAAPACPQSDVAQLIPVSPLPATQERKGLAACNCAHAGWGSRREAGGGQRGGGTQQGGARLGWD